MKTFFVSFFVAAALTVPARAQSANDLSDRIGRIEASLKTINKKLANNYIGSPKVKTDAERDAELMQSQGLEESVRTMTDEIERMNFERKQFADKFARFQDDVSIRFKDLERRLDAAEKKIAVLTEEKKRIEQAERAAQEAEAKRKAKEAADAKAEKERVAKLKSTYGKKKPKALYDEAFAAVQKKNYKDAEKKLEAFLELYPDDALAGNAQYWLGETYFAREQYDKAAVMFAEGFQKYRTSPKAPDNLFKLGRTMSKLNKKQEACIAFANFAKEYPQVSETMKTQLKKEMSKLKCP